MVQIIIVRVLCFKKLFICRFFSYYRRRARFVKKMYRIRRRSRFVDFYYHFLIFARDYEVHTRIMKCYGFIFFLQKNFRLYRQFVRLSECRFVLFFYCIVNCPCVINEKNFRNFSFNQKI